MKKSLKNKLIHKYRLVLLNEDNFEQKISIRISQLNIIGIISIFSLLWIGITIYLMAFTPLRYYIPGYNTGGELLQSNVPLSIIAIIISIFSMFLAKLLFDYLQDTRIDEVKNKSNKILLEISSNLKKLTQSDFFNTEDAKFKKLEDFIVHLKKEVEAAALKLNNALVSEYLLTTDKRINRILMVSTQYKNEIIFRFQKSIYSFSRRANINLIIGVIITLLSFAGLGYTLFQFNGEYENEQTILNYFLPRFLILAFVQVFAFFFLKNYRSNVEDIKYYQNEITNIELKSLGLIYHSIKEDSERNNDFIINELIKTDRNFVLNKGQSTVNIDKENSNSTQIESFAKEIIHLLNKKKYI